MPLAQTRMPPGLAGLLAAQEQIRGGEMDDLRQAAAAQGLLAQLQERQAAAQAAQREAAFRNEIAAARTPEQQIAVATKYMGPKDIASMQQGAQDRAAQRDLTRESIAARLEQNARFAELQHEVRLQSAASADARNAEIARHNKVMEGINAEMAKLRSAQTPKPPPGFRFKADNSGDLEAIPGGPKDTAPKDAARAKGAIQKADTVISAVDEALTQTGTFTTGTTGQVLGMIPGTAAYDLDGTLDTIKANLGFAELQAMRDASPTGGALGQVAVQELNMLQSTLASLKRGLSRQKLESGLRKVREHMANWKKAVAESAPQAPATAPATAAPAAPAAPASGGWSVREKK